ncbi:MAG: MipA/OmpV family protein [bacterium]|nr:MipA/OmpV family protein [bacterium]
MRKFTLALALTGACSLIASSAFSVDRKGPPQRDLEINVGAGAIYTPAFLGSKDYQLSAVPNLSVKYKDQFFASVQDGIGYNLIRSNGWRIGPVVKYAMQRKENGNNPFRIVGNKTDALRGLGDVDGTMELGGFAEYRWREWSAKADVRQGVNGHQGFVTDLNANYTKAVPSAFWKEGSPLILSVGPRATLVDSDYNQTYFGVNASQSARSGLSQYKAEGGLLSYGIGALAILPITDTMTATWIAGYERVAGDGGDSPLVQQRGSEDQAIVGMFFSYAFGY